MVVEFKNLGAGAAVSALGGCGNGVGFVFGNLLLAIARNPAQSSELFNYAIFGFALTEAVALFVIMLSFLILFG